MGGKARKKKRETQTIKRERGRKEGKERVKDLDYIEGAEKEENCKADAKRIGRREGNEEGREREGKTAANERNREPTEDRGRKKEKGKRDVNK